MKVSRALLRLAGEAPFRIVTRALIRRMPCSTRLKAQFDAVDRPQYLAGLLAAVDQARTEHAEAICAIEFGVASGNGLIALQSYAEQLQREEGIRIDVFGFDSGRGLTDTRNDYRDHPDVWTTGDYPMNEEALRKRLGTNTKLILGDVSQTVREFTEKIQTSPIGFIAFDLDLYSSTCEALKVLNIGVPKLRHVPVYFDDTESSYNHNWAGVLLAIKEFNSASTAVKLDNWRGLSVGRPFFEASWLDGVYMAHDLEAVASVRADGLVKLSRMDDILHIGSDLS